MSLERPKSECLHLTNTSLIFTSSHKSKTFTNFPGHMKTLPFSYIPYKSAPCVEIKVMYLYSLWCGDRGVSGDDLNALWRSTHQRAVCRRCLCLQSTNTLRHLNQNVHITHNVNKRMGARCPLVKLVHCES